MTLADTGPVVAILNENDQRHELCHKAMASLSGPLIITDPVITEAMYLLGKSVGSAGQQSLWRLVMSEPVEIANFDIAMRVRMRALMEKYGDIPMDYADASLVVVAETRQVRRVFTLDSHFLAYRIDGKQSFDVIP